MPELKKPAVAPAANAPTEEAPPATDTAANPEAPGTELAVSDAAPVPDAPPVEVEIEPTTAIAGQGHGGGLPLRRFKVSTKGGESAVFDALDETDAITQYVAKLGPSKQSRNYMATLVT